MSVPQLLYLVNEAHNVLDIGIDSYLEYLEYQPFTNEMILQLSAGNTINDFNVYPEYHLLPNNEKEYLKLCNFLLEEYKNQNKIDCPSSACGASLGFIMGGIGTSVCGPVCGGVGFIIGFMLGSGVK